MSEQERRREERLPVGKMILLVPSRGDRPSTPYKAWLQDWSPQGIGIVDPQELKPGDEFAVSVNLNQTTMALYLVRHSASVEGGLHKIGAELRGFIGALEQTFEDVLPDLLRSREATFSQGATRTASPSRRKGS